MDSTTEQKPSIQKLVVKGASPEDKKEILAEETKELMKKGAEPIPGEKEKSIEDLALISLAKSGVDSVRRRFGLDPIGLPISNVHLLPGFEDKNVEPGTVMAGVSQPEHQRVIAMEGRTRTESLNILAHELLHFGSYGAMQLTDEGVTDYEYRSGFTAHSRDAKKQYFHSVDEALTEILAKEVVKASRNSDFLAAETARTEAILATGKVETPEEVISADYKNGSQGGELEVYRHKYLEQRNIMDTLVQKVYQKNSQRFTGKEEVYDLFMKGKLQGNFYEIGKTIDATFGKGTFRRIGEVSNGITPIEDYRKYIESL